MALRLQQNLRDLAKRALTASRRRHVMDAAFYFGPGIGRSERQPGAPENRDVGQIVPHVRDLVQGESTPLHDFVQDRHLLDVALVDIRHSDLLRADLHRFRFTARDDTCLETFPYEPLQRDPILRVETLGLEKIAISARQVVDQAVGDHTIDIHKQQTNFRRALLKLGIHD